MDDLATLLRQAQGAAPGSVGTILAYLVNRDQTLDDAAGIDVIDRDRVDGQKLPKTPTINTPTRTTGVSFQPSVTATAHVSYSLTLVGKSVSLLIGAADPPTVTIASLGVSVLSGLVSLSAQGQLATWVPAGWYVELVESGAGSATLDYAAEAVFS